MTPRIIRVAPVAGIAVAVLAVLPISTAAVLFATDRLRTAVGADPPTSGVDWVLTLVFAGTLGWCGTGMITKR